MCVCLTITKYEGSKRAITNMADMGAAILVSVGWTKMCVSAMLAKIHVQIQVDYNRNKL